MSQQPQTFVVNTTSTAADPEDGLLTLGEAIAEATGKGDKIVFDKSLSGQTVHVNSINGFGPMDFTDAHGLIIDGDINGDGMPDITISGDGFTGLARVHQGSSVTLHGLKLVAGKAIGMTPTIPTADYLNDHDITVAPDGQLYAKAGKDAFQTSEQDAVNVAGGPGKNGSNAYGYPSGPGTDGNHGFDGQAFGAIVNAGELTLDNVWMDGGKVVGQTGLAINGGAGGTGATGVMGNPSALPVGTIIGGGNGGRGGNASDGGDGGIAAPIVNLEGAILTLNDTMISGYDSVGGAGGKGGTGGAGGNSGNSAPATHEEFAGTPGNGGNGGDGGNGGMGVGIIANYGDLILQTNFGAFGNTEEGGAGGAVGLGGMAGILNGFNGSIKGTDGHAGTSAGKAGDTRGGILQKGDLDGSGSITPTSKLMFMDVATPTEFEGTGAHAGAFSFGVGRFGDDSEAATFTWKINFKQADKDDFVPGTATSGSFQMGAGIDAVSVGIQLQADKIYEGDETFVVKITNQTDGIGLGTRSALLTILDDDGPTKGDDDITLTDKDEKIDALAGNDTVRAMGGNDTLTGNNGNDTLIGGAGSDKLTGDAGADMFVFSAITDSAVGKDRDVIMDFVHSQHDKIDLSGIDAKDGGKDDKFELTAHDGSGDFTHHKGELRITSSGNDVTIELDTNGDGKADSEIALHNGYRPTGSDFIL